MAHTSELKAKIISWARECFDVEINSLSIAAQKLSEGFVEAVNCFAACEGKIVVTGLGKSGHVARKIASTLSSTGSASFFLHPSEALHGDLGMIGPKDCILAVAFGGETTEILEVVKFAKRNGLSAVGLTGKKDSSLAKLCDLVIDGSVSKEACPLNLAPTSSSTLALVLGDALAVSLMNLRGFREKDFAQLHPSGSLGRKLMLSTELMRPRGEFHEVSVDASFDEVMEKITRPNFGIVAVTEAGTLTGAITDGDIRRSLQKFRGEALKLNAKALMCPAPKTIGSERLALDAFREMEKHHITSLFVLNEQEELIGLIRMHDLFDAKIV